MANRYEQWLCTHIGSAGQIRRLLKSLGNAETIFRCREEQWKGVKGLSDDTKLVMEELRTEDVLAEDERRLARLNGRFLWFEDEAFPARLLELEDCPYGIFLQGHIPNRDKPCIAIVGTRGCSNYGAEMARYFAKELSAAGVVIVSGLAAGIDSIAQKACLEAGGETLGILGSGIGVPYPKENWELYQKVREHGGILSEYPPGTKPMKYHFPMRNRLISGFADGTLVIEAREKSGTLITVDRALEQGKDVFALPGRITDQNSVGCNRLIQQGAKAVTSPEDILCELSYRYSGSLLYKEENEQLTFACLRSESSSGLLAEKVNLCETKSLGNSKIVLATNEKMVYSLLRLDPKHFDMLVWESNLSPQELTSVLAKLESDGWIRQPIPNYYTVRVE